MVRSSKSDVAPNGPFKSIRYLALAGAALCIVVVAGLQGSARIGHSRAIAALSGAFGSANDGKSLPLTISQFESNVGSSKRMGIGPDQNRKVILYRWQGPLMSYYVRLFANPEQVVVAFDTQAQLPSVAKLAIPSNSSAPVITSKPNEAQALSTPAVSKNLEERFGSFAEAAADAERQAEAKRKLLGPRRPPTPAERAEIALAAAKVESERIPIPKSTEPDVQAIALVKELLKAENDSKLITAPATILQSEYLARKKKWYQDQYMDAFRRYGTPAAQDSEWVNVFFTRFVELMASGELEKNASSLNADASKIVSSNFEDPLVLACALQIIKRTSSEHEDVQKKALALFAKSKYTIATAIYALSPWITAVELSQLQTDKAKLGADPDTDAFALKDSIDLRILHEHLTHKFKISASLNRMGSKALREMIVAVQSQKQYHPWLESMLLANYTLAGGFERKIYKEVSGTDAALNVSTTDLIRLQPDPNEPLGAPYFKFSERTWAIASNFLLTAWKSLPENPEPAAMLLDIVATQSRQEPPIMQTDGSAFYYQFPVTRFAGELPHFWLNVALRGQFDYEPAYEMYWRLMNQGGSDAIEDFANQCLDSQRFDTNIPFEYLKVFNVYGPRQAQGIGAIQKGTVHDGLVDGIRKLAEGYSNLSKDEIARGRVNSYLCCIEYLNGDAKKAFSILEGLGQFADPLAFDRCKVTAAEIRNAAAPKKGNSLFALEEGQTIDEMAFARKGDALFCLDEHGVLHGIRVADGRSVWKSSKDEAIDSFLVSKGDERLIELHKSGEVSILNPTNMQTIKSINKSTGGKPIPNADGLWYTLYQPTGLFSVFSGSKISALSAESGEVDNALSIDSGEVHWMSQSEDRSTLALISKGKERAWSFGEPASVTVLNAKDGNRLFRVSPFSHTAERAAFNGTGKLLAVAGHDIDWQTSGNTGRLFANAMCVLIDVPTGKVRSVLRRRDSYDPASKITGLKFVESDKWLAVASLDQTVRLWNVETGALEYEMLGHNAPIESMAYEPHQHLLATGDRKGQIMLWHLDTMQTDPRTRPSLIDFRQPSMYDFKVHPSTGDIATKSSHATLLWNRASGYREVEPVQPGPLFPIANGDWLSLHTTIDPESSGKTMIAVAAQSISGAINHPNFEIEPVPWTGYEASPDGTTLFTAGSNGHAWNLKAGQEWKWGQFESDEFQGTHLAYSPSARRLAVVSLDRNKREVKVWQLPENFDSSQGSSALLSKISITGYNEPIAFSFDPDGKFLVAANGFNLTELYDVQSGQKIKEFHGSHANYSPAGDRFFVVGTEYDVKIYDPKTWKLLKDIPVLGGTPKRTQWGPDNRTLYFILSNLVQCLDTETGKTLSLQEPVFPMLSSQARPGSLMIANKLTPLIHEQEMLPPKREIIQAIKFQYTSRSDTGIQSRFKYVQSNFPEITATLDKAPIHWNQVELPNQYGQGIFGVRFHSDLMVPANFAVVMSTDPPVSNFSFASVPPVRGEEIRFHIRRNLQFKDTKIANQDFVAVARYMVGTVQPGRENLLLFGANTDQSLKVSIAIRFAPSTDTPLGDSFEEMTEYLGITPIVDPKPSNAGPN